MLDFGVSIQRKHTHTHNLVKKYFNSLNFSGGIQDCSSVQNCTSYKAVLSKGSGSVVEDAKAGRFSLRCVTKIVREMAEIVPRSSVEELRGCSCVQVHLPFCLLSCFLIL